jgi:hypothetical protein
MNYVAIMILFLMQAYQPPSGPPPRTSSGKVDFSGVWARPCVPDMTQDAANQKGAADLPFTPWGESEWKNYDAANGDYTGACLPFGMTRSVNSPGPIQIMQNDTYVALMFETNNWLKSLLQTIDEVRLHRFTRLWHGPEGHVRFGNN